MGNLVHGLADTNRGSEVEDHVHARDGACHRVRIAHIAAHPFDASGQILRPAVAMNLRREVIEDPYCMALPQQSISYVRPDKTSSSGNQDALAHLLRPHGEI